YLQRFDQKPHSDGGAARGDGESDARGMEKPYRGFRGLGQGFVLCQKRPVDIGYDKSHSRHLRPPAEYPSPSRRMIFSTIVSTVASIGTLSAFSSGSGGSSALNWLSSNCGGMKWSFRRASRSAIKACVPWRNTIRTSARPCKSKSRYARLSAEQAITTCPP